MTETAMSPQHGLPQHRVEVAEQDTRARNDWVTCRIGQDIDFSASSLAAYCHANWNVLVYDAFLVAAAVQFADHTKTRPMGRWARALFLRLPVHDPDLWNSTAVSSSLHETLTFLTGDQWNLDFCKRKTPAPRPRQYNLVIPGDSRVIIPFSDGLDSRAVAGLLELCHRQKLIRVRLASKSLPASDTEGDSPPFASMPYRIRYGKARSVEYTGRSRGFKFAMLTGIAAYLCGANDIVMPESGQGSLGPVLIPVGQAYPDYRNYPLFTDRMSAFLVALVGHKVSYRYPRLWNTKAETLHEFIGRSPDGPNWVDTRSCWRDQRHVSVSGKMRQCGICAACMLRRMSVHAAGLIEDTETYVWENLRVHRFEEGAAPAFRKREPRGAMYEYAVAGTLHHDHLAGILRSRLDQGVLDRTVSDLSRSLGLAPSTTRDKLQRLLLKHTEEWHGFVDALGPSSFVAQWIGKERTPCHGTAWTPRTSVDA